jgi:radical SAM protein with 4Fe4S-binding SPASM domain
MVDSVNARRPLMNEARTANQQLNIEEFSKRRTALESMPLVLFVELTQNCNLECPSCRSGEKFHPEWNMVESVFDKLADETFDTALIVDLRGYGESLILKDFPRAADRVLESGARLRLVSNGQINRNDVWDKMMAADSMVALSCDAASPELFAVLRAGGTVEKFKKTARTLVRYRDLHGAPQDVLSIYTVVSGPNLDELGNIVELAGDVGIGRVTFAPVQMPLDHPWNLQFHLPRVRQALDHAIEVANVCGVRLKLASSMDPSMNLDGYVKQMCMHPWAYAYISHEGRVGFCDHLIGQPTFTFGSLWEQTFREIWNSKGWQDLRRQHTAGRIEDEFSPCRWCYTQRYVDFENEVHPSYEVSVVSTAHLDRLWQLNVDSERAQESFLGESQVTTLASHKLLPLSVRGA